MDYKKIKRAELYKLLGDLPLPDKKISAETVEVKEYNGYNLEKLTLDMGQKVPAYFVSPKTNSGTKFPVVLFCHSHGGKYHLGKDELIQGNSYMCDPPYAEPLTAAGYAALCIDSPIFGERSGRDELSFFKEMIWQGKVLWGLMVYDHLRAIDYLHTRDDVDTTRIASLGMSMGSTMSWWLAALDERIKVCIDICCMTDFQSLIEAGGLNGHGIFYYVPNLLKYFDTADINALTAPRPHLSVNGLNDALTPANGLTKIDLALKKVYAEEGAAEAWLMKNYPVAHDECKEMREDVMGFLSKWL